MLPGTKKSRLTGSASVHLDMIRGLAAVAVLAGHVRGFYFIPYHLLPHHSASLAAIYAVTALGHEAVIVFFVLSGFFIASSIIGSFETNRWSWIHYLVNRVVRLSLVLLPALVLCWIVDHIGMALSSTAAFYEKPAGFSFTQSIAQLGTVRNFFGNLFYLQSIRVPAFGSDAPLWSLSYEFWYYMLFPLALCAFARRFPRSVRLLCAALAVLIAFFVGRTIAMYFFIWLLGAVIAESLALKRSESRLRGAAISAPVLFAAVLLFSVVHPIRSAFFCDLILAVGFTAWLYVIVQRVELPLGKMYTRAARWLAGFSYSLYLTHLPLVLLLRARVIHNDQLWAPTAIHFVYAAAIVLGAIFVAYGISLVTEARTAVVRKYVMAIFAPAKPAGPRPEVVSN